MLPVAVIAAGIRQPHDAPAVRRDCRDSPAGARLGAWARLMKHPTVSLAWLPEHHVFTGSRRPRDADRDAALRLGQGGDRGRCPPTRSRVAAEAVPPAMKAARAKAARIRMLQTLRGGYERSVNRVFG